MRKSIFLAIASVMLVSTTAAAEGMLAVSQDDMVLAAVIPPATPLATQAPAAQKELPPTALPGVGSTQEGGDDVPAAEPTPGHYKYCETLHIEFNVDRHEIPDIPANRAELLKVCDFMKKYPTTTAVIAGHTDNVGDAKHNLALSRRRAEAVVDYLADKCCIERTRLSAKGYGATRPIADNNTETGRRKNRRIEAIIDCVTRVKEAEPFERFCMHLVIDFEPGQGDVTAQSRGEIAKVAEYMKQYPTTTAVIEGHTDNVGDAQANLKLSQQRAESVAKSLVQDFGIDPSRVTAKGYGSTRPIAYNDTAKGRAMNRRINAIVDCVVKH